MSEDLEAERRGALEAYRDGRFPEAVRRQVAVINRIVTAQGDSIDDQMRLAGYFFGMGDHASAAVTLKQVVGARPDDAHMLSNYGTVLSRLGRFEEAYEVLARSIELAPEMANAHDAQARVASRLERFEEGRRHGEISLELKDAQAAKSEKIFPIPETLAPFGYEEPRENVIAFSLWGANGRYCDGALRNARLAPALYPGWRCRFFCDDTVPQRVRAGLTEAGAEIVMMERKRPFDGLFWRFLVINDGRTKRFLIRDADSVINVRERVAVDEWLASGKAFHVMRDFWSHSEVMLAGMWGGVGGVLPPLDDLLADFHITTLENWHLDQWFLRQMVWPTARQSCLVHDSIFRALGARDFPAVGRLPPDQHVGQNAAVVAAKKGAAKKGV